MILYFFDDVVAFMKVETDRPLVPASTCEAFNLDLHTGLSLASADINTSAFQGRMPVGIAH